MSAWFAYPCWLLLILAVQLLGVAVLLGQRRRRQLCRTLLGPQSSGIPIPLDTGALLRLAACFLLAVGIAGPWWGRDSLAAKSRGRDVIVLLDISRSMLAEDREGLARLERGKRALTELVETVKVQGGVRLALVGFAGRAKLLCPLTDDLDHFLFALDSAHPDLLGPAGRVSEDFTVGTSLQEAFVLARREIDSPDFQDCLLVSDGEDLTAFLPTVTGLSLHVLGVGVADRPSYIPTDKPEQPWLTYDGARVQTRRQDHVLSALAEQGKGLWIPEEARPRPLVSWFRETLATLPVREWDGGERQWLHQYRWFYLAALGLLTASWMPWILPRHPRERPLAA